MTYIFNMQLYSVLNEFGYNLHYRPVAVTRICPVWLSTVRMRLSIDIKRL